MVPRLVVALLLGFVATAPQASPQVYKWVDARGVVNYSTSPPPDAAATAKPVDERISIIGADPSVARAAAAMREREARRAERQEREWQQRQSALLAQQPASVPAYCAFGPDCGLGYYPVFYPGYAYRAGGRHPIARWRPHPLPHAHRGPLVRVRAGAAYSGPRGGAYASVRAGSYGGRGASR
jgi:hypothetical protein